MPDPSHDYLTELLDQYWFAPPVALWRAIELRILTSESYPRPILDLGCGDGLISQVLFSGEKPIEYGFDPWFNQVRKAPDSHSYITVQQALGNAMPYTSSHFATVFTNSVLEHIPDLEPVLLEVARVLKPGGKLIATVPSDAFRQLLAGYQACIAKGDPEGAEAYARKVDQRLEHHRYLSPHGWHNLLQGLGLELVRSTYYIPLDVASAWDQANNTFGIHKDGVSIYRWLASPRFRKLGYQKWIKRIVVRRLSVKWRRLYDRNVAQDERGAGLLVVARKIVD